MALIQLNFISECLMRTVTVNAIVPFDKIHIPGMPVREKKPFKTLYLLHGIFGNYTDWVSGTRIQQWAEERNLAVIMPSGENHFYLDCEANGERYSEFIGKELPEKMQELFPLSTEREDTFIGGLSMGGYGAVVNGLKYNQTFGNIIGLSCAFMLDELVSRQPNEMTSMIFGKQYSTTVFGDLDKVMGSDKDPKALLKAKKASGEVLPKLYIACGVSDGLCEKNAAFAELAKQEGYDCVYEEGEGAHEWIFWDTFIKKALDWLPLEEDVQGINSGNVG